MAINDLSLIEDVKPLCNTETKDPPRDCLIETELI